MRLRSTQYRVCYYVNLFRCYILLSSALFYLPVSISIRDPSGPSIHIPPALGFSIISLRSLSPSERLYHALVRLNIHKDRMVLYALKDRKDNHGFARPEAMTA